MDFDQPHPSKCDHRGSFVGIVYKKNLKLLLLNDCKQNNKFKIEGGHITHILLFITAFVVEMK